MCGIVGFTGKTPPGSDPMKYKKDKAELKDL